MESHHGHRSSFGYIIRNLQPNISKNYWTMKIGERGKKKKNQFSETAQALNNIMNLEAYVWKSA